MLSSEPSPALCAFGPPHGHRAARDCMRLPQHRQTCTHASDDFNCNLQATRSRLAYLLRSPERRCSDASAAKQIMNVQRAPQSPPSCAPNRIPPEILSSIFEECLDKQTSSRALLLETPLVVGRVCNYWRSVAQRTPRLWTSLSLRFCETKVDRSRDGLKVTTAVETWLQRSHPIPLSIAFTDNRIFQKDTEDIIIWLLSCIRMHASRWKAIHLKFSSDYFVQLAVLSSCALTSLASFSVHIDHMGWRRGLLSLRLDLSQAGQLTSLAYTGPEHVIREDILLDWARLTSVALSYDLREAGGQSATLPRYFSSLALCRGLTELSIGLSITLAHHLQHLDAVSQGQTATQMVELPVLHTLRVRRLSRSVHACSLIDALILPQLLTLDIDSAVLVAWDNSLTLLSHPDAHSSQFPHMDTQLWHAHHFSALLERSACHLHTLHIRDVDISPLELTRLLTSQNTSATLSAFTFEPYPRAYPISDVLTHLISVPSFDSTLVAPSPCLSPSLTPSPPGASPNAIRALPSLSLPSLTQLRLGCAHESHLGPLADMIASRTGERATRAGAKPLAVFELVFYDFVYSRGRGRQPCRKRCFDVFKERVLRCAREGGVDVDIRVERPYEPMYLSVP